ncbi:MULTISPECIES: GNAT family N-acetyltransferase [Paenibacillus]|uniref:GNAT family N-acetyltransferase n=1 Tax=Paenibacillus TaxID=44249 RepID=UPI002FE1F18E
MEELRYYRGTECEWPLLFAAFQAGFSDYLIRFQLTMEQFADRFFGPEGNAREHSFVALRGGKPVGLVLGGIREYEGVLTMRCGALAVIPDERGRGVSRRLMELHREEAVLQGCRQLYLEVIAGNDRAIAFYDKLGYRKVYELSYFSLNDPGTLGPVADKEMSVGRAEWDTFEAWVTERRYFHLNWQNDLDYIRKSNTFSFFSASVNDEPAGMLAISGEGRVSVLLVDPSFRCRGAATLLLRTAARELDLSRLSVSMANNAWMEGFLQGQGFQRESLFQYEMYLTLPPASRVE